MTEKSTEYLNLRVKPSTKRFFYKKFHEEAAKGVVKTMDEFLSLLIKKPKAQIKFR